MNEVIVVVLGGALVVVLVVLAIVLIRRSAPVAGGVPPEVEKALERLERELRRAVESSGGQVRLETGQAMGSLQTALIQQVAALGAGQGDQLKAFGERVDGIAKEVADSARDNRSEQVQTLERFARGQADQIEALKSATDEAMKETRVTLQAGLAQVQQEMGTKLEESRTGSATLLVELQAKLLSLVTNLGQEQNTRLETFGQRVEKIEQGAAETARKNREETAVALKGQSDAAELRLTNLTQTLDVRLAEIGKTLETRIGALQAENAAKLEEMRKTVDEKLQTTLEARLGESFRLVSERLEQVSKGLGEMQTLATGVGDLKKVLTNVKTRGNFGEVQLGALLEQILTPEQFATNMATRPGSGERVEFAVRLPGADEGPCWLPIDAKFPVEDYERLLAALDTGDLAGVDQAGKALENRVRTEAKTIREKYIEPPHTTDFGLLFLPTEGLYAEVLRRPGLVESLQREQKVVIAGPTTLAALLNSLSMGFRTLAIQKRSAEVWKVLGAVKSEFGKFEEWLQKVQAQLQTASNTIQKAGTRTRAINRRLREVESLPAAEAAQFLPAPGPDDDDGEPASEFSGEGQEPA